MLVNFNDSYVIPAKAGIQIFCCHLVVKPGLLHGSIFLLSSRDLFTGSS
ncbi:hypothetical protein [Rickettsia asembonensis]|nr:hypothetical protein [Rickettsia asembonensis]